MKGDFSRGHNPDRKRGKDYRRVLLQQGRLLLDSDFNAGIDAQDQLIRELASDLGCQAGSPDLGYLLTPGELLALFDPMAGIEPTIEDDIDVVRDYSNKYLDRYPSLKISAPGDGAGGSITIPFITALSGQVDVTLWVRAETNTDFTVTGVVGDINAPGQTAFARRHIILNDPDSIEISLDAGEEIWIALIETDVQAGFTPAFGVAEGCYYLEGLTPNAVNGPIVLFDMLSGLVPEPTDLNTVRDDAYRYLDQYPSLKISAPAGGTGGIVRLPFRFQVPGAVDIDLWVRADANTDFTVPGVAGDISAPGQSAFERRNISLNNPDSIEISLNAGEEIWLALVELRSGVGYASGLWPAVSYGPGAGFAVADFEFPDGGGGSRSLQLNDRLIAYLEAREHHINAIDDQGIKEMALGGEHDTCTRTHDLGQVKLLPVGNTLTATQIKAAMANRRHASGTLDINPPTVSVPPDPCAIPVTSGYTGRDHRLYRFEIHQGGSLPNTVLKWSRNNGAEVFPVADLQTSHIDVPVNSGLRDGDLVEILTDVIEYGDAGLASLVTGNTQFQAPERAVGNLVRLGDDGLVAGGTQRRFGFRDDPAVAVVTSITLADYGNPLSNMKARRWNAVIEPGAGAVAPFTANIEDGLSLELSGTFEVGAWWQYEARVGGSNDNGPWQSSPHGPERLFTPLALFEFDSSTAPLELIAWLDRRFSSLCGLDADDIAFDGDRIGSDSDTIQEVIEELYEREVGGCCDITLEPEDSGNDTQRIIDALADFPPFADVVVCLKKGIYRFQNKLSVFGRRLEIRGCPEAVIQADGPSVLFELGNNGRLALENLTLFGKSGVQALVFLDTGSASLEARNAGFVNLTSDPVAAVNVAGGSVDLDDLLDPFMPAPSPASVDGRPAVRMENCAVLARTGITGGPMAGLTLRECILISTDSSVAVTTVGFADLSQTSLRTGADLTNFTDYTGWTAENLLHRSEELLAQALSGLSGGSVAPAFAAEAVLSGTIRRTFLTGRLGMLMGRALFLTMETNSIMAAEAGIMCKESTSFRFEGGRVVVAGAGAGAGLHFVYNALSLRIAESEITSDEVGIMLMAPRTPEHHTGPAGAMIGVDILDNTIIAGIGVQLGRFAEGILNGSAVGIHIRGNTIASALYGLLLKGEAPKPTESQTVDVHVTDNAIAAASGIGITGPNFSITGNRIAPLITRPPVEAIRAIGSENLIIQDNQIYAADAQKRYKGIYLEGCNAAIVQGNVTRLQNNALEVKNMINFSILENTLQSTGIQLAHCSGFRMHGNELGGQATIINAGNVMISGNRINNGALMQQTWGNSDIHGNRLGQDLIIEPGVETSFDFGLAAFPAFEMVAGFGMKPAGSNAMMAAVHLLADEVPPEAAEGPFMAMAAHETLPRNHSEAVRIIASDENMEMALGNTLAMAVDNAFLGTLWENLGFEAVKPVPAVINEKPFSLQVNDNWCANLRIGRPYSATSIEKVEVRTVVQAIGNFVTNELRVRPYPRRNISQNVAKNYPSWISSQATAVNVHNLNLP